MESFEALSRCIGRNTAPVAKALRKSLSLVHKWQEPAVDFEDSGTINPLDIVESIMATSESLDMPREDVLAPLQYLTRRFDCLLFPLPEKNPSLKDLNTQLCACVKQFGQLMEDSAEAMADGRISTLEKRTLDAAGERLIHHVSLYLQQINSAVEG